MTNVYLYTQGCKVNQYETEAMSELLENAGYHVSCFTPGMTDIGEAFILINSCTVTAESDRKLRQFLRRCRREHPKSVLVLTGCYPQAYKDSSEDLKLADIILGNAQRSSIVEILHSYEADPKQIWDISNHTKEFESLCIKKFDERTRAFIKIQDGCNNFCTYCIIPFARGRIRSKLPEELKKEVESLAQSGYKEIVLTGINLTTYGYEWNLDLADAVHLTAQVEGIERIRLGSLEPDDMTPQLIQKLKCEPKLCPQFHLALQSGCDETLKRMNRRYDTQTFKQVARALQNAFEDCALTTDLMVGFPGETEEEYQKSKAFTEEIGFSKIHVFPYSVRPGTKAAGFPNQLSQDVKNARCREMIASGKQSADSYLQKQIGKEVEVLIETKQEDGYSEGYTKQYLPVKVQGVIQPNTILSVRIVDIQDGICLCKPV